MINSNSPPLWHALPTRTSATHTQARIYTFCVRTLWPHAGILEDEHFEWGSNDGSDAFEAIGPFLVDGGCCGSEEEAKEACRSLAEKLSGRV